jgi:hypothetical protein
MKILPPLGQPLPYNACMCAIYGKCHDIYFEYDKGKERRPIAAGLDPTNPTNWDLHRYNCIVTARPGHEPWLNAIRQQLDEPAYFVYRRIPKDCVTFGALSEGPFWWNGYVWNS